MKRNALVWNWTVIVGAVVLMVLCFCAAGCDEDPTRDIEIRALQSLCQHPALPSDVRERARTALAKYQDQVQDRQPILIVARLITLQEMKKYDFALWVFDEDRDLAGFVVREEVHGLDGTTTTLEERYPIFAHLVPTWIDYVYHDYSVPIRIRSTHQRKDEKQWADYAGMDFGKVVRDRLPDQSVDGFWSGFWTLWEETLPAVWMSLPEPNRVDVSFYVYDKAGNKSNIVKPLIDPSRPGGSGGHPYRVLVNNKNTFPGPKFLRG